MSDTDRDQEFVRECLEKWTSRYVANGMDYNDVQRLIDRIDGWSEWCDEFAAVGDEHVERAEDALDRDDEESAGEHFRRASMCYHFGSNVWHLDSDRREQAQRRAVSLFRRAGNRLDPPVERIEAPHEDYAVPGNLRVPDEGPDGSDGDSPLVILLPGSDSIKEELGGYGRPLLDRGIATLAVDGAGQGETHSEQGMTPDYWPLISSVVDRVLDLDPAGVDVDSLGVYGVSLGGYYAPHVAANDDRFDACVGISGKFTVGPTSTRPSEMHKEHYLWACKTDSMAVVDEITEEMTLRDEIGQVDAPLLEVTGTEDTVTPPVQTRRIAEGAPDGEFVLVEGAGHVCNDRPYTYRPYVADWLREQLA